MRGTFFRQVMFSEFELAIHEAVERGEALTGSRMTQIYGEILERYHGHDAGVMEITDRENDRVGLHPALLLQLLCLPIRWRPLPARRISSIA